MEQPVVAEVRAASRPFVGRVRELTELRSALADASSGRGSIQLVTGEAGIGKTRLMQVFGESAREAGWRVLTGRCWEEGGAPPYWPWIQVVRAAGADFERLAIEPTAELTAAGTDPESVRFRLFDAVTRFLLDAARPQPLVITIDDLHAADAPSLLLLRFLGDAIADAPVLVVGSYREGERRVNELATLFGELVRVGRRISLAGLTSSEVESYVEGVTGDLAFADSEQLRLVTGGNPFFLGEVMRMLAAGGQLAGVDLVADPMLRVPEEVRTLIRRRVSGLSREAITALEVGAVIGREFDFRVLQRTGSLGAERLVDVLAEAVDTGLLSEAGVSRRYQFVHELVRETLYEGLPPSRRLELHLRIGRTLEELSRSELDPPLSEIARHLALATPLGAVDEAVEYLGRAGDRAAELLAYEEAALHYGQALQLLGTSDEAAAEHRGKLLLRLADAQWRAGDASAARISFEQATEDARRLGDAELLGRAALGYVTALGGFLLFARFEAGATGAGLLQEALDTLPPTDSPLRARLLARLAVELYTANQPVARRLDVSADAIQMAHRLGDSEALVMALHARHWALTTPELAQERLTGTEEMLRVARDTGSRELVFLAHNARFHCFLELCDGQGMAVETAAMTEISELIRQPFYRWHTVCLRTIRATLDGRLADAARLSDEALEIGSLRHSQYPSYVFQYAQQVAIHWAQGRLNELWPRIERHAERFPWVPRWREALAAAELGDERAARAEVDRHAGRDFADLPRDGLWMLHVCSLAQACVLIADKRRGEQLYELLLPYSDRNAVSYTQQPLAPAALRLGMLATMLERWEEAERHFQTAVEQCELLGAPAFRARVLIEHVRLLLARARAEDESRAATLLDEAVRLCEELGLTGLLERVSALRREVSALPAAGLRREGEFWTVVYTGKTCRLRDSKGLQYLAFLLAAPGQEFHALELAQAAGGHPGMRVDGGAFTPVLDAPTKEAYRQRLADLGNEVQEAREWGDLERIAIVEAEIDAVTDELARAAGLGGRDRMLPSPSERARVSVTKAIKTAIRSIERHHAELGGHLSASIRTGRFCSYAPPGEAPPRWAL